MNKTLLHSLSVALIIASATSLHAANGTWTNNGTDFNSAANWTPGLPGATDRAFFNGVAVSQPDLSANFTLSGITFNSTTTSGYVLSGSNGTLTLTSTAIGNTLAALRANNTAGNNTISASIILGQAAGTGAGFFQAASGLLSVTGNISSTNAITGLTLSGSSGSKYSLSGNNTYSGNTTIGGASVLLNINSATAISTGALVAGATGTIDNTSGSAIVLTNNNNISLSAGDLSFTGTNDLSFGSGVVSMTGGSRKITVNAKTLSVGSIDADDNTRVFTKAGSGVLAITGAAGVNFQGGVSLVTGNLLIGHKSALGTGLITVAPSGPAGISASTDLSGANAIANNILFSPSGSSTFTLGGANNLTLAGTFTIGSNKTLTVTNSAGTELSGAVYLSDIAGSGYQLNFSDAVAGGILTVSGNIANFSGGAGTAGSVLWTGGVGTTLRLTSSNSSYTGTTGYSGTSSTSTIEVTKLANGGVNSSIGASSNAASNLVIGQAAVFRYVGTGDSTDRLFTVDGVSATGTYSLASSGNGAISFTNNGTIAHTGNSSSARTLILRGTNTGNNTLAPVWSNNGVGISALTKLDTGTWVLAGANTYTGATSVGSLSGTDAGILRLSGTGKISNNATTVFAGTLDVGTTSQTITTLGLGAGASGTSANIIIGAGGLLNLGGGVTYTATNNPDGATISGAGTLNLNGNRTFAVNDSSAADIDLTISSNIADGTGSNSINKTQAGTLVLGGNNTYSGGTTLSAGTLGVSHNNALGTGVLSLSAAAITLQAVGSDVVLSNSVSGTNHLLTVSGSQNLTLNGGLSSTLGGTVTNSIGAGKVLTISNVDIGVGASSSRTLIFNGTGDLAITGVIANGVGANSTQNFSSRTTGTTTLSGNNTFTGILSVTTGTLVISNGSVNTSSTIQASGGKLKYDSATALSRNVAVTGGATFAYNSSGNYTGTLTLTDGKLGGTNWNGAKLGGLSIGANQTITPGNSVGTAVTSTQTWANSGSYDWEINQGNGTAGNVSGGWDLLSLSGALTLSATSGSPFTINIISLGLDNLPGLATGFNQASSYNWLIADAGSAISGFSADKFSLNATAFQNSFTGAFGIELGNTGSLVGVGDNSQIYLTYTAIPEPSTWALIAVSGTVMMVMRRRRRD